MLTTGVRTPVGIKVFGTDLARDRARRAPRSSVCSRRSPARAACSTSATWAASTSTSSRDREALARYGLRVGDVQRRDRERHRRRADRDHASRAATASPSTCATRRTLRSDTASALRERARCPLPAPATGDGGAARIPLGELADIAHRRRARPWCATRPACWSATSTSTSTRARDLGGYVDEAKAARRRAPAHAASCSCRPGMLPEVDRPVRAARARCASG